MKRRNTETKAAILQALKQAKQALSQEVLQAALGTTADRATIYRVLNQFTEDGLVHKIVGDDGRQYFAICTSCAQHHHQHNHFHFRCRTCNTVACLPQEIEIKVPENYSAESFNGIISGICASCRG